MPILQITGDDFGLNAQVNAMIERDHEAGILTHAGLIVAGPAVDEAVRIAKRHPKLQVGLHLVLSSGPGLGAAPLPESPGIAGARMLVFPAFRRQIELEIDAQIERFCALDLPRRRWDGHCHLHLHPAIFPIASRQMQAAGFQEVRLLRDHGDGPWLLRNIFNRLSRRAERQAPKLRSLDCVLGLGSTGRVETPQFLKMLNRAARLGLDTEIYYHPGAEPSPLDVEMVREKLRSGRMV